MPNTAQQSKPSVPAVVDVPISDIQIGRYQPRRGANPAREDIKQSMARIGQLDPVILSLNSVIEKGERKYIVSIAGNTRVEVARELGLKSVKAIVVPIPSDIEIWMRALDSNRARGEVSFSDTAHAVYNCYKSWRAKDGNADKPLSHFHAEHCKSFVASYVYLCIAAGEIFDDAQTTIPPLSKSMAEGIVHVKKKTVVPSFVQFKYTENETAAQLEAWGQAISAAMREEGDEFDPDSTTRDWMEEFLAKSMAARAIEQSGISPSKIIGPEKQTVRAVAESKVRDNIWRATGGAVRQPVTNPVSDISRMSKEQENAAAGKRAAKKTDKTGSTARKLRFQLSADYPPMSTQGKEGCFTGALIDMESPYARPQMRGALAHLDGCLGKDNVFSPDYEAGLRVWRKILPGLFAEPKGKPPMPAAMAGDFIASCVRSMLWDRHNNTDGLKTLLDLDKKYGMLSDALVSLGLPARQSGSDNVDAMLALTARMTETKSSSPTNGHASAWSASAMLRVAIRGSGYDKYIGVFLWPRLVSRLQTGGRDNSPEYAIFNGRPDLVYGVGFVAGFYDSAKSNGSFRFPTSCGTLKGAPIISDTPEEAIRAIAQPGFKCVVDTSCPDNSPLRFSSRDENSAMIQTVMDSKEAKEAIAALYKKVRKWTKSTSSKGKK